MKSSEIKYENSIDESFELTLVPCANKYTTLDSLPFWAAFIMLLSKSGGCVVRHLPYFSYSSCSFFCCSSLIIVLSYMNWDQRLKGIFDGWNYPLNPTIMSIKSNSKPFFIIINLRKNILM